VSDDLCFLSVAEAGRQIKTKKLSPVELAKAYLSRIEKVDPLVHSYLTVTPELALKEAKAAESEIMAGKYRGPMHGIPYAVKDNIETAGVVCTGNSALLKNDVPENDATCVALLKQAGGVHLGKTMLREMALGVRHDKLPWPYPLNPWNRKFEFGGGSSTGSAAAVGASLAACALGTDTGGSVRNPSGFCGLAGIKPSYGRISRAGVIPNTFSLDSVGPMCQTVEDCAIMLGAVSGFDPLDPGSAKEPVPDFTADLNKGIKGLRVGVIRHFFDDQLPADDESRVALEAAAKKLAELGAKVTEVKLRPLQEYLAVKVFLSNAEFYAVHEKDLRERPELFGPKLAQRAMNGMLVSAADYIQAQRQRWHLAKHMRDAFKDYDVMVTLTTIGPAPSDEPEGPGRALQPANLTMPFSISGFPAMSVPTGFDKNGLPLAMQIAGKGFDEAMVFRVGHAYEQATPWHKKRPVLKAA
jgi:aspartyl-tRNA(Asn)/glutamyl-tRNA(Gln) amidotransferase subunit A